MPLGNFRGGGGGNTSTISSNSKVVETNSTLAQPRSAKAPRALARVGAC